MLVPDGKAPREKRKHVVIIGAGIGGVATAARLAKEGYRVSVFERNSFTGGRCSLIHHEGWRFDRGPSLLLLPRVFQEVFHDLGTSMSAEGIKLHRCNPNYVVHFHDGRSLSLSTDLASMKTELERFGGKAAFDAYLAFLRQGHAHYELSVRHVLSRPFNSYLSLLRPSFLWATLKLHPFGSVYAAARRLFATDRLRRAFTFAAMYMGMSPFEAPATYSLLQYTELAEGIWYPNGGFHAIIEALVKVGELLGVEYHLNSPVDRVSFTVEGKADGVVVGDQKVSADLVVVNADLVAAYNTLFESRGRGYAASLSRCRTSCSSISLYWSLSEQVLQLGAHNIFLAERYRESFDQIFKDHAVPDEPSFYVNVPSRLDPSAAPAGKDSVVVLIPCGHLPDPADGEYGLRYEAERQKWETIASSVRTLILKTIEERLGVDIAPLILHEQIATPYTWAQDLNLDRGAILGLSHDFFNVLSFRPRMKMPEAEGVWFVGASTHPGTGVPIVIKGSEVLCKEIVEEEGRLSETSTGSAWAEGANSLRGSTRLSHWVKGWIASMREEADLLINGIGEDGKRENSGLDQPESFLGAWSSTVYWTLFILWLWCLSGLPEAARSVIEDWVRLVRPGVFDMRCEGEF